MALIIAIGIRLVLFYYFKKQQAAGSEDSLISGETRKDVADRLEYRVISASIRNAQEELDKNLFSNT